MQAVGTDLFSLYGEDWIVLVDRYSGYLCAEKLRRTDTESVIKQLTHWFQLLGWPETIRSDGWPQYRKEFDDFCEENDIQHELSSPYNPQSNGLAEAAVKNAKQLLIKCKEDGTSFQSALSDWRNIPRADKSSPAQLMFGRRLKSKLPMLPSQREAINKTVAEKNKDDLAQQHLDYFNIRTKPLSYFEPGDLVRVRNTLSGKWNSIATVVKRRPDNMSYVISIGDKEYTRGRRLLKSASLSQDKEADQLPSISTPQPSLPRRSTRATKPITRFTP